METYLIAKTQPSQLFNEADLIERKTDRFSTQSYLLREIRSLCKKSVKESVQDTRSLLNSMSSIKTKGILSKIQISINNYMKENVNNYLPMRKEQSDYSLKIKKLSDQKKERKIFNQKLLQRQLRKTNQMNNNVISYRNLVDKLKRNREIQIRKSQKNNIPIEKVNQYEPKNTKKRRQASEKLFLIQCKSMEKKLMN